MTESNPAAWIWWLGLVTVASMAGHGLARRLPWLQAVRTASLEIAFGVCLGPFLAGLAAVAVLGLLPGASPRLHLAIVIGLLASIAAGAAFWSRADARPEPGQPIAPARRTGGIAWFAACALVLGWVVLLLFESLLIPLLANDALEYATVGRLLFETRDLLDYPAIDPRRGSSGFFGPWTHPPLYVAHLYLAYAAQGHADMPGVGRMVSPWFFLGAALLVRAMGDNISRFAGLLAMLVFLSTPLAIEGAASASIDPLTMAGAALVLCAVALVHPGPGAWGTGLVGLLIGLALWAHSGAVVLVPLSVAAAWVLQGFSSTRRLVTSGAIMATLILVVAAWPYGRNLLLFGALVSDNPVVFAMPELHWDEYFAKSRSLDTWSERIQFGILKPWTALRSFGLTFWLLLPAAWLAFRWVGPGGWGSWRARAVASTQGRLLLSAVIVLLGYWAGMMATTLVGMDLMIKNDRYMLVVLPCAALVAGGVLARLLASSPWIDERILGWRDHARAAGVATLSGGLVLLWLFSAVIQIDRVRQLGLSPGEVASRSHEEKLRNWGGFQLARRVSADTPQDAVVLAERPADLYYADRRMISFLDPRLVPVYREPDPVRAAQLLTRLGVTHLQLPGYFHPAIYRTAVEAIAARPDLSTLVFSHGGDQLYALDRPAGRLGPARQVGPAHHPWVQAVRFSALPIGLLLSASPVDAQQPVAGGLSLPLLQRSVRSEIIFGGSPLLRDVQKRADLLPISAGDEFLVEIDLEGDAYARVLIYYFEGNLRPASSAGLFSDLIGEIALSPETGRRTLTRRLRVSRSDVAFFRLVVEHRGNTWVQMKDVRVRQIQVQRGSPVASERGGS